MTHVIIFMQIAWETSNTLITSQLQYFQTSLKIFQEKCTLCLIKRTLPSENHGWAFFLSIKSVHEWKLQLRVIIKRILET